MLKITPAFKASAEVTGNARAALAAALARCYKVRLHHRCPR